jgi:hypothetical protein
LPTLWKRLPAHSTFLFLGLLTMENRITLEPFNSASLDIAGLQIPSVLTLR